MPRLTLRNYQRECVDAHYTALAERGAHPLFEVPTGGGKSLIIAEFVSQVLARWPNTRIAMLTHSQELIQQNHDELIGHWPGGICPIGIWSAGLNRREPHAQIVYASIQSCLPRPTKPRPEMLQHFDLVLIDEAHLVPKADGGRYRTYLDLLTEINPNLRVVGYTATPYRLDGGFLHRGEGALFTDIAYSIGVERLISEGYLCNLRAKRSDHQIDTTGVAKRNGDWSVGQLEDRAMEDGHVEAAVTEAVQILRDEDRKSWLVFAIGIDHAGAIVDAFRSHGVSAESVFGGTPKTERADRLRRFKSGALTCLINVGCLTTGFNAPRCDALVVMRPTQSVALYVQMMGRGMRTFPGKPDCLVLDYGMNVARHGPINMVAVDDDGDKKGDGEAPTKVCPGCKEEVPIAVMVCPGCGQEFESLPVERAHQTQASDLQPVAWETEAPKPLPVREVEIVEHRKPGSPPSMRVTYLVGMHRVSEWICFEHEGYPRRKAMEWWLARGGEIPAPETVDEAVLRYDELRAPTHAVVTRDKKYWRVSRLLDDGPSTAEVFVPNTVDRSAGLVHRASPDPHDLGDDEIPF